MMTADADKSENTATTSEVDGDIKKDADRENRGGLFDRYAVGAYRLFARGASLLQPLVLLSFRLPWGCELFKNGAGKLKNHSDIVDFFTSLGIPLPDLNAWFVGGLECFGGIFLMLGLFSRPLGFLLAINMTVAYLAVKDDRTLFLNMLKSTDDFDAFTKADPYFFWLTAIVILAFGAGPFSLDKILELTLFKKYRMPQN